MLTEDSDICGLLLNKEDLRKPKQTASRTVRFSLISI